MNASHFYLTLPSNASMDVFPDNKTTSYRVSLPQPIDLNGEWEVGLYSISYPHTWYTLEDNFDSHIYCMDNTGVSTTVFVQYGYYDSVEEIVEAVNSAIRVEGFPSGSIKLSYSAVTGKVTFHVGGGYQLYFKGRMSIILGFGGKETIIAKTMESPHVADLHGTTTIYVYCNIVQPQIVGDTNAQLLRSIPVEGVSGDIVTKTLTNIQYVPVQIKSFEDMEVLLRNDTGDPVPFERGKVVITLHFRQRNYFT